MLASFLMPLFSLKSRGSRIELRSDLQHMDLDYLFIIYNSVKSAPLTQGSGLGKNILQNANIKPANTAV